MNFNVETTSTLFHFCNELANALRAPLNTGKFQDMDVEYWQDKLTEFKIVIDSILNNDKKILSLEMTPEFINNAHLEIFTKLLLKLEFDSMELNKSIIVYCNDLTKLAMIELYGVEL